MYYYPTIDRELLWDHLPLYIFLFSLLLFIIIFTYIKLAYPFWNTQPVFHNYDFWRYWTTTPFLIQTRYPIKTKYCNFQKITTLEYLETSEIQRKEFVDLLQCYYIPDESAIFMFNLETLDAYMTGHYAPSYLSFYREDYYTINGNLNIITDSSIIDTLKKPIGCISARPIDITFSNNTSLKAYFWEFICIKREKADRNISRFLIQTQEYRQRHLNMDAVLSSQNNSETPISISIFKKEIDLCKGIVPLIQYNTKICKIYNEQLFRLPPHFVLIEIGMDNIGLLVDFLEMSRTKFQVFGIAELTNLMGLIKKQIIMIYCVQKGNDIYAAYFFRDSRTQYEDKGVLLVLCGSINNTNSVDLFYMGFLQSLREILKKMSVFSLLMIENLSHNKIIYEKYGYGVLNQNGNSTNHSFGENVAAYYLYNYVVPKQPFTSEYVFMVL